MQRESRAPAVVSPLDDHMGLDIARSLGSKGIAVFGLDDDPFVPGRFSRFCRYVRCPDPHEGGGEAWVESLVRFGKTLDRKAVLYPLSDTHVLLVSAMRDRLRPYYEFVMPPHETVVSLVEKDGLYEVAHRLGIETAATVPVRSSEDLERASATLRFPVIIKPQESTSWLRRTMTPMLRSGLIGGRAKVMLCPDRAHLLERYAAVAAHDPAVVVQEIIPGDDENLVYISFCLDRGSVPLAFFAGRKHRVIPTGFGSASYVRSFHDDRIADLARRILAATRYQGLGGIEFKMDIRDGRYKLIEFNARFGMWDGLGTRCGVDLPFISYRDALGESPAEREPSWRDDVAWVDLQRDVRAAMSYLRQGKLTLGGWLRSLRGEKMTAIFAGTDRKPGAAFLLGLVRKAVLRLFRR